MVPIRIVTGTTLLDLDLAARHLNYTFSGGYAKKAYLYHDGQGSTRVLADDTGTVVQEYTYTAFGELYNPPATLLTDYLYAGQQYDDLTGLYNLRARMYDPALGRFLGRDVAEILYDDPVELNRYVYTANNPINMVDPSGLMAGYAKENENPLVVAPTVARLGKVTVDILTVLLGLLAITIGQKIKPKPQESPVKGWRPIRKPKRPSPNWEGPVIIGTLIYILLRNLVNNLLSDSQSSDQVEEAVQPQEEREQTEPEEEVATATTDPNQKTIVVFGAGGEKSQLRNVVEVYGPGGKGWRIVSVDLATDQEYYDMYEDEIGGKVEHYQENWANFTGPSGESIQADRIIAFFPFTRNIHTVAHGANNLLRSTGELYVVSESGTAIEELKIDLESFGINVPETRGNGIANPRHDIELPAARNDNPFELNTWDSKQWAGYKMSEIYAIKN